MDGRRIGQDGPDFSGLVRDHGDIDAEVHAARTAAALFDFSFMARARLRGPGAAACLETFQPRPVAMLPAGSIAYSLRTDVDGYVRTDLTTWRIDDDTFEVFSGDHRDIDELRDLVPPELQVEDLTDATAILAVQGPHTPALMQALCGDALDGIGYFAFRPARIEDIDCTVGRLGYTGEKGVELIVHRDHADALWKRLAAQARPAGFVAIDRLRIEAGFILFANECRLPVIPAELGMQRFAGSGAEQPEIRLVCFRADIEPGIEPWQPGDNLRLPVEGEIAVTSACRDSAGGTLGLGFVPAHQAGPGRHAADNAGHFGDIVQVPLPAYDPKKQRPRGPW